MSLWLDKKYVKLLPFQIDYKSGNGYANFRCVVCGDSAKIKNKKRGWFLVNGNHLTYFCHNCNFSQSFSEFLKSHYNYLYQDYIKELLSDKRSSDVKFDMFETTYSDIDLLKIKDLPKTHNIYNYINQRQIPLDKVNDCYYSDNFYYWCKQKQPETFNSNYNVDKRLIFPFRERNGNIYGLNGRSVDNKSPKYLSIKFKDVPKIYGLDKLDIHKKVYVCEGPIDSLFLPNSIAVSGALGNLENTLKTIGLYDKSQIIVVTDNEPRNKFTCKFISNIIDSGYSVVLWSNKMNGKDVNDFVMNHSQEFMLSNIKHNTFSGMTAKIKFSEWKKIDI